MKLIVVLLISLVLASLVSALPSNPRTNNFASSDQYSPRDDARMNENRGLQYEGPGSYDTDPIKNSNSHTGRGRPQDIPQRIPPSINNNSNPPQPSDDRPQNNPQGPPTSNGSNRPGGYFTPSYPGIRPHQGTMDSHLMPRPMASGFPANPSGSPMGPSAHPDQPIEVKPAFEGCEKHDNSVNAKQTRGHYEVPAEPMKHNSHIALYPMTDDNHALYVKVMMPNMQYKAKIQGTNVKLEKCHASGIACQIEDEASTKSNNLIQPQQWNYMYSQISDGKITIGIGPETKVMTMNNIPAEELDSAEWVISSGDDPRSTEADGQGRKGGPFLVQFPCAEYVAQHLPSTEIPRDSFTDDGHSHRPGYTAPQIGYSTEPTKSGSHDHDSPSDHTAAIVVGVVVALLIIALVVAIAISVHRKRSFKVNENTPLSDQKKSAATSQEQQKPQQSQQQEVELHDEK